MATDVTTLTDTRLFAAEDGLHQMFDMRLAARADVTDVVKAFDVLASEMYTRGLVYTPLGKANTSTYVEPKHFGADGDGDDDDTNADDADPDNDGGNSTNPSGDINTQRGGKPKKATQKDGPVVKKDSTEPGPNATTHPAMDDGLRQKGKTKSGKGGESGRTQDTNGAKGTVDGSDTTLPDDGLRQKNKNKKGRGGQAGEYAYPGRDVGKSAGAITTRKQFKKAAKLAAYVPHAFAKDADDGPAGDSNNNTPDHRFVAVRNICRLCRRPAEDHLGKALGYDGTVFKAVSDDTIDDRQGGADDGTALPDGSFWIPDEAHLHQAIRLVGQAPDPQSAMNHIIERAQAMGLEAALPPAWRSMTQAGQPDAPQVGPGANTMGAQMGAGAPAGAPGSKVKTAPGAAGAPPAQPSPPNVAAGASSTSAPGAPPKPKPPKAPSAGLLKRLRKKLGSGPTDTELLAQLEMHLSPDFEYAVVKSTATDRFTLGPVYMPNTYDAHGEWATAEDLQKSIWDYVAETGADRRVYLQHSDRPAGEWLEIVSWPQEVKARMIKTVDGVQKSSETTFPAGTVYMGVRWEPWAYDDVKKGKVTGFSMGGFARRVEADIPS